MVSENPGNRVCLLLPSSIHPRSADVSSFLSVVVATVARTAVWSKGADMPKESVKRMTNRSVEDPKRWGWEIYIAEEDISSA